MSDPNEIHRFADTDLLVMAIVNRTRDSFYDAGATFTEDVSATKDLAKSGSIATARRSPKSPAPRSSRCPAAAMAMLYRSPIAMRCWTRSSARSTAEKPLEHV